MKESIVIILTLALLQAAALARDLPRRAADGQKESRMSGQVEPASNVEEFLPKKGSLFQKDAIDEEGLEEMDCHLRNVDFCFAGLLGGMRNPLPETDSELESRCDEMKASMSCVAVFNERCSTFKVAAAFGSPIVGYNQFLSPSSAADQLKQISPEGADMQIPESLRGALLGANNATPEDAAILNNVKALDLLQLCEPDFKKTKISRLLRNKLFSIGKCANNKIHLLNPCLQDLKIAFQIFYEPNRTLPLQPSCCAISRFRQCARGAMDEICGLSSYEQLEQMLTSSSMGSQALKMVNRICRQEASKFDSPYCLEVLPPTGLKAPPVRRGSKSSKLAKVLDLISLSGPPSPESMSL